MDFIDSPHPGLHDMVCFKKGYEKIFVLKDEIIMFSTNGRRVDVYTTAGRYSVNAALNEIEKKLNDARFFRSSQSYLINLKMVKKVVSKAERRHIEFHRTGETALLSKSNERKLYEMIKII